MSPVLEAVVLVVAGAVAATAGSAGGITSLVSYPALLLVGVAPLPANVTNSVALTTLGLGAALSSRAELADRRRELRRLAPVAVAGAVVGAVLLLVTPEGLFAWIVPFLIAAGSVVLLVQPAVVGRHDGSGRAGGWTVVVGLAGVSIYNGYFGAGSGVLVLAVLLVSVEPDLVLANALKNVLLLAGDLVVAVLFALTGPVVWAAAVPLAAGAFLGGTLGPVVARRAPRTALRVVIGLSGLGLAGWLFVRALSAS